MKIKKQQNINLFIHFLFWELKILKCPEQYRESYNNPHEESQSDSFVQRKSK